MRRHPLFLFVLWSQARPAEARILDDLHQRFQVLDAVEVTWSPGEVFARSLTRMYGDALEVGSEKERHCGTGPFRAVVVADLRPRYSLRHTSRGRRLQNIAVFDARQRYRAWTGGGHRVHASDSALETERNLRLLLDAGTADYHLPRLPLPGERSAGDPVGTHGWDSRRQLDDALAAYGAHPVRRAGSDATAVTEYEATDVWWALHIAGGVRTGPHVCEVLVAGRPFALALRPLPPRAQRVAGALHLHRAVPRPAEKAS